MADDDDDDDNYYCEMENRRNRKEEKEKKEIDLSNKIQHKILQAYMHVCMFTCE